MNAKLSPLKSFVLPGGTALAAHLHLARAIARRAETVLAELATKEKSIPAPCIMPTGCRTICL